MTDDKTFIAYLVVTGVWAVYILVDSFFSRRAQRRTEPAAWSYLQLLIEIPVAIGVALMWPLGLLALVLYVVLKGLGVKPRSKQEEGKSSRTRP